MVRISVATVVCASSLCAITPVVATPSNPSDVDLERARQALTSGAASVSELAGQVSSAQERLAHLELSMGQLREAVNKSLVDLHDSQVTAEHARQAAASAKTELGRSQQELDKAQDILNEISRTAYRRGASSPLGAVSGKTTSAEALDRSTYLRTNSDKQRRAIEELDRARTVTANRESELRKARNVAERREAEAQQAQQSAQAAIEETSRSLERSTQEHERLLTEQRWAQQRLDAAKNNAQSLLDQREEFEQYQAREKERRAAEQARQAEAARKEAREAAQRDEHHRAATAAAAAVASKQPEHTRLDNPYPQNEDAQSTEVAEIQNPHFSEDTSAEEAPATADVTPEASATATSAREVTPEITPREENDSEEELSEASATEETEAEETAMEAPLTEEPAAQTATEETESGEPSATGAAELSSSETTGADSSSIIETVIARAMSQVGQPYAWGGGTANGPSQGIRDGGVADSHGDYNKVGFDCSGLTLYAFAGAGISLPHYTGYQYQSGTPIDPSDMKRGDLIFYGPTGNTHVAIYLGNGQMIEAPQSGSYVQVVPVRWAGMSPHAVRIV
ncbi:C40 family peptidase [Corynebacterium sp. zg-331]|uniref:DIP1281 family NlpC/P60 protein n=1 Tax=unclassified Corynebacterium TaxID=2624378 RepID=UPI00128B957C|nr:MULTISPECIES: NlpC/P60 family protein [unclassified Corynebacterium]MBC3185539.1 C40 family peptidase [Corynebacterium sp. zg-331]MPV52033.1 hydrolase [Corynebacterium sp. zg331]